MAKLTVTFMHITESTRGVMPPCICPSWSWPTLLVPLLLRWLQLILTVLCYLSQGDLPSIHWYQFPLNTWCMMTADMYMMKYNVSLWIFTLLLFNYPKQWSMDDPSRQAACWEHMHVLPFYYLAVWHNVYVYIYLILLNPNILWYMIYQCNNYWY